MVSQAQCQALVASADVSDLSSETALEAMARLGLQFATDKQRGVAIAGLMTLIKRYYDPAHNARAAEQANAQLPD